MSLFSRALSLWRTTHSHTHTHISPLSPSHVSVYPSHSPPSTISRVLPLPCLCLSLPSSPSPHLLGWAASKFRSVCTNDGKETTDIFVKCATYTYTRGLFLRLFPHRVTWLQIPCYGYMYMYIYIYIYIHLCINAYIHICICIYMYICICIYTDKHMYLYR